jgi:hypothetical protein
LPGDVRRQRRGRGRREEGRLAALGMHNRSLLHGAFFGEKTGILKSKNQDVDPDVTYVLKFHSYVFYVGYIKKISA